MQGPDIRLQSQINATLRRVHSSRTGTVSPYECNLPPLCRTAQCVQEIKFLGRISHSILEFMRYYLRGGRANLWIANATVIDTYIKAQATRWSPVSGERSQWHKYVSCQSFVLNWNLFSLVSLSFTVSKLLANINKRCTYVISHTILRSFEVYNWRESYNVYIKIKLN